MFRLNAITLLLILTALSAGAGEAQQQPDYGTGWDLFASSGAIALREKTVFMTWPSGHCKAKRVLAVIDVADPAAPKLRGSCSVDGFPQDMALTRSHAYVVNGKELLTFDITQPAQPRLVTRTVIADDPLRGPQGIDISAPYAYLACRRDGVKVVDLTKPAAPVVVGHTPLPGISRDVTVAGDRLYVASGTKGIQILDRTKPTRLGNPIHLGAPEGVVNRIVVVDTIAYLAAGNLPVACVCAAKTTKPTWLGSSSDRDILSPFYGAFCFDLAVQSVKSPDAKSEKTVAFSADGEGGLIATDVSDPIMPTLAGVLLEGVSFGNSCFPTGICADNSFAYLNDARYGLRIVNITKLDAMVLVGPGISLK